MNNIWKEFEGDNWFERNRNTLGKKPDNILLLLELYKIKPEHVLEIGAANGYRLAKLNEKYNCAVDAVEPSKKAVENGKEMFPFINFKIAGCEDFENSNKYDLVIINFVFHWIYRENLYKSVEQIDKSVKDGGFLVIGDFGVDTHIKKKYHHLENEGFYTWKMPYWKIFTESGNYMELAKLRYDHESFELSSSIDNSNMATAVLLKKQDMNISL